MPTPPEDRGIEEIKSPLYALKNRIKWDYSYYISREKSANGYWERVDSIDQVPLHAARTHRTHPVDEPDNMFLYKIYLYLLSHHQELQKAREIEHLKCCLCEKLNPKVLDRHSLHTSLVAAVEGQKQNPRAGWESAEVTGYNAALDDTLTIINSLFKE